MCWKMVHASEVIAFPLSCVSARLHQPFIDSRLCCIHQVGFHESKRLRVTCRLLSAGASCLVSAALQQHSTPTNKQRSTMFQQVMRDWSYCVWCRKMLQGTGALSWLQEGERPLDAADLSTLTKRSAESGEPAYEVLLAC